MAVSYDSSSGPIAGTTSRAVPTRDKIEFTRLEFKWTTYKEISKGVDNTSQSLPVDLKLASNQLRDTFLSFDSNCSCIFTYFEISAKPLGWMES